MINTCIIRQNCVSNENLSLKSRLRRTKNVRYFQTAFRVKNGHDRKFEMKFLLSQIDDAKFCKNIILQN
jgi:hypothetical protein